MNFCKIKERHFCKFYSAAAVLTLCRKTYRIDFQTLNLSICRKQILILTFEILIVTLEVLPLCPQYPSLIIQFLMPIGKFEEDSMVPMTVWLSWSPTTRFQMLLSLPAMMKDLPEKPWKMNSSFSFLKRTYLESIRESLKQLPRRFKKWYLWVWQ